MIHCPSKVRVSKPTFNWIRLKLDLVLNRKPNSKEKCEGIQLFSISLNSTKHLQVANIVSAQEIGSNLKIGFALSK